MGWCCCRKPQIREQTVMMLSADKRLLILCVILAALLQSCRNGDADYLRAVAKYEEGQHDAAISMLRDGAQAATSSGDASILPKYHESLCMAYDFAGDGQKMMSYAKMLQTDAQQLADTFLMARAMDELAQAYIKQGDTLRARSTWLKTFRLLPSLDDISAAYLVMSMGAYKGGAPESRGVNIEVEGGPDSDVYQERGSVHVREGGRSHLASGWVGGFHSNDSSHQTDKLPVILTLYQKRHDGSSILALSERIHEQNKRMAKVSQSQYLKVWTWLKWVILLSVLAAVCYLLHHRYIVRAYMKRLHQANVTHTSEVASLQRDISNRRKDANRRIGRGRELYDAALRGEKLNLQNDGEKCLIEFFSIAHYETFDTWMKQYKGLTPRLTTILILQDMGKSDKEMEAILCIGNSTVRSYKTRLKAKKKT